MNLFFFFLFVGTSIWQVSECRINGGQKFFSSSLIQDTPQDNRVPIPEGLDFVKLYCYDDPTSNPGSSQTTSTTAQLLSSLSRCTTDTDCEKSLPFCVEGFCRECRSSSDCTGSSAVCNYDTQFTCSSCVSDSDCGQDTTQICRSVSSPTVDRKTCVTCTSSIKPPNEAVLVSPSNCDSWTCPDNQMMDADGTSCTTCPQCRDGQYMIPGEFFSSSRPKFFFPTCKNSRNAKCIDCPSIPCATVLSPSYDYSGELDVAYLPPSYPCNAFKCNSGWYLDKSMNQCRLCQLQSCENGKFLNGCGGSSPGTCIECPSQMVPSGTAFVDPKSIAISAIEDPKDVCRPSCSSGFFLSRTSRSTPWQCANCNPTLCPAGYFLSGCGPDENPGQCLPCASNPPAGWFWTPNHYSCGITKCTTCGAGSALIDCGGSSAGTCTSCPFPLPANANHWFVEFDQLTMTNDTCSFSCASGFYREGNKCLKCTDCPLGKYNQGCSGRSPGQCIDCPTIGPFEYFIPSTTNSVCQSAICPKTHDTCSPGQFLSNCGGVAPGTCESCKFQLPPEAADWVVSSEIECDFSCKQNFYPSLLNEKSTRICLSCDERAKSCPIGTHLVGCSTSSSGTCQSCPPLPTSNSFYSSTGDCSIKECSPSATCQSGEILIGCGGTSAGKCTPCDSLQSLPENAEKWISNNNQCVPVCRPNFHLKTDNTKCVACNLDFCRTGYVLTECTGSNPGRCVPCDLSPLGHCYSGPGKILGQADSCPIGPCVQQQI